MSQLLTKYYLCDNTMTFLILVLIWALLFWDTGWDTEVGICFLISVLVILLKVKLAIDASEVEAIVGGNQDQHMI